MKALIQRVSKAEVEVDGQITGAINQGLLVFIGIEKNDEQAQVNKMIKKILAYRVFYDADEKMNLSVKDVEGELLLVSQFTLAADTNSGTRPGFSTAKVPAEAKELYEYFLSSISQQYAQIQSGVFGADMQVSLTNDGPVTFLLSC
ncbi:D-tyrosyl-tRNA(Tyr) deacylase [Candidatus Thioglobus autotrophicus]|jgi:D-tyrosyl-tRNA(Tyr) deacylase|uniref:D-aminoacyl-tRNA deacylase n=1 Tax=Candidatus Thioglobus autotrophicus TaxID=1705394 RepID=A0A0M5LEP5_9GAMM|nr:D-aminoacyl-tRNA deacylase [Candidatus Thioglobus autotrophicus]ALE52898.1 D-tyrosyl-tRNA(Tyr) deacylase [Candidatus Thioglobus autotrophicus]WPE18503.1 D-aminoacyl-tRNA deacylase [Candidatus Thioglobus autotrophicus]